jgi:hypothetical protein
MLLIPLGFLAGQKMPTMHNMVITSSNKFARCWPWVEGHWAVGYTLIQQFSLSTLICIGISWVNTGCVSRHFTLYEFYGLFAARIQRSTWLTLLADYHVCGLWNMWHAGDDIPWEPYCTLALYCSYDNYQERLSKTTISEPRCNKGGWYGEWDCPMALRDLVVIQ